MNMKISKLLLALVSVVLLMSCGGNKVENVTTIQWIEDKPGPTYQECGLFSQVPDSLWFSLGLQEGVPSAVGCFLMQTDGKTILFDAGLGAPFSRLMPTLEEKGIACEDIDLIYVSHLHPDHIGGLLKEGQVAFPNAELYVNRLEAEAWLAMMDERSELSHRVLEAYEGKLHCFEAGDTLPGGVVTIAAYGHTPGHTAFQKDSILIISDLIHGAALQVEHPEYCVAFDMSQEESVASRIHLMEYAKENNLTIYGMHLPNGRL